MGPLAPVTTLVDTDVLIDAGHGVGEAVACLAHYEAQGRLAVSVVTQMELIVGCRNKRALADLNRFLRRFDVILLDARSSARAAALVEAYRLNHGLLMPDALIAATALEAGRPLVTKNRRDFRFIPGLNLPPYPPVP